MASLSTSTSSSSSTSTGKRSATVAHLDFINIIPTPYDVILPLSSNHKGTTDFKEHVNKLIENVNDNDTKNVILLSYVNSLRNQRYNFVEQVDGRYCSLGDEDVMKICEAYYNIAEVDDKIWIPISINQLELDQELLDNLDYAAGPHPDTNANVEHHQGKRIKQDDEHDSLLPNAVAAAADGFHVIGTSIPTVNASHSTTSWFDNGMAMADEPFKERDVLLGRGTNNYGYPGTICYTAKIVQNESNFVAANSKGKEKILQSIVDTLRFDENRRFFLKENNGWILMDRATAINKAERTMRGIILKNRKDRNRNEEYRKPPDEDDDGDDDNDNDHHPDRDPKQKKRELNSKRDPSGSSTTKPRADTTNGNITRQASDCLYSNLADLAIQQNFKKLTLSDSSDNYKFGQEQISKEILSYFRQQIRLYWLCIKHDCMDCSDLAFIKSSQSDMIRSKLKAINLDDIFEGHAASKTIAHSLVFTDDEIDCLLNLYNRFLDRITPIDVKTITCQRTEKITSTCLMDDDNCDNKCNDGMSVSSSVEDVNQDENQTTSSISNASESLFSYVCVRPPTDGDMAMAVDNHPFKDYGRKDPSTETLNPEIGMKIGGSGTGNTTDTPIDQCIDTDVIFATGTGSDLLMHNPDSVCNPNLSTMLNNRSEDDCFSFNIHRRSSNQDTTNTQNDRTGIVQQFIQSEPRLCDVTFPVNGNTFFKDMVNLFYDISKRSEYRSKQEKEKRKKDILYSRVWLLKNTENSRFLEYNRDDDKWYELGDKEIFQKFNDWFECNMFIDRFEDDSLSFGNHSLSSNQDTTNIHTDDLNGNIQPYIQSPSQEDVVFFQDPYHSIGKERHDELVKEKMDDAVCHRSTLSITNSNTTSNDRLEDAINTQNDARTRSRQQFIQSPSPEDVVFAKGCFHSEGKRIHDGLVIQYQQDFIKAQSDHKTKTEIVTTVVEKLLSERRRYIQRNRDRTFRVVEKKEAIRMTRKSFMDQWRKIARKLVVATNGVTQKGEEDVDVDDDDGDSMPSTKKGAT